MKKRSKISIKVVLIVCICLSIVAASLVAFTYFSSTTTSTQSQSETAKQLETFSDREKRSITIAETPLFVEVVTTKQSTTQGLSGRSEIGSDGMLFVFPTQEVRQFWMPDMQFNIDIVWIRDSEVVGVSANVPKPVPGQKALPTYSSSLPVNVVLELPSGKASELGIQPGSKVIY